MRATPARARATWVVRIALPRAAVRPVIWAAAVLRAATRERPRRRAARAVATWAAARAPVLQRSAAAAVDRARVRTAVAAARHVAVAAADAVADSEDNQMRIRSFIVLAAFAAQPALGALPADQKNFTTPEAAVQALIKAAKAKDEKALLGLFGSVGKPLIDSGDPVADKNARDRFLARYQAMHSLDKSKPDSVTLEVGDEKWPFPIPIAMRDARWFWDSAAGTEEIVNRRVGENELDTIQSCLAFVDAQQEYYLRNVQKDALQHYANKLISSPGKKDGLYWPAAA